MADTETLKRILNPLVLNLQKMELELKCPTCLKLLDMPIMLPCTHIFCSQCIPVLAKNECPSCKSQFLHQDMRPASHLKSLVQIFKEMSHVVATTFHHQKSEEAAETMMVTKESPVSGNNYVMGTSNTQLSELQMHASKSLSQRGESNGSAMQKSKTRLQRLYKEVDSEGGELLSPSSFGSSKDIGGWNSDCANRQPGTGMLKKQKMSMESKPGVEDEINAAKLEYNQKSSYGTSQLDIPKISSDVKIFKCMFCHSSEIVEGSGPMVHFVNGKDVGLAGATHPNAFHVHEKCYQWSPQIYYANETLLNLEVELARASKIKCSKCNVKGAALGCYVKTCRRSYHVPCAYGIYDVRWDCENFLMLCPYHSSKKLPCDKSKSKSKNTDNNSLDYSGLPDQTSTPWNKDWVLCCSGLSKEEGLLLEKFACISGASVLYYWDSTVSHVIASVDDNGGCKRTLKVLMSILTGRWVLTMEWVKACLEAGKPVPEEQYEVTHDVHGCYDGPKTGRLRALQKEPKLFDGMNFYVTDDFHESSYRKSIVDLVLAGGGNVIALNDLSRNKQVNDKVIPPKPIILYNSEPLPEDCHELMKQRIEEAEALAADVGGLAIPHTKFLNNNPHFYIQEMTFFKQPSPALLEILNKIARSEKPIDAEHELHEFGLVRYHVQASSLFPQIVYLSIYTPSLFPGGTHFTQLPETTSRFIKTTYSEIAEIVEPPRTGFVLTLKINFSNISNSKGALNKSISDLSSLKAVLVISQLKDIFWNIGINDGIHKLVKLVHHSQEPFFVIRQQEKAVTIFPMRFKEDSDVAFATSLFQEFIEARHSKAPNCSWSPIPPPELLGEAFEHLNTNGGFVSFEILPNHVKGARADKVIWTLLNFDAYVKYHIKSMKGFIQRKMRRRMDILVEVVENARIGRTEVIKKPKRSKRFKKLKSYTKPTVLKQKCKALISRQIKRLNLRIRIKKLIQIRPCWFKNPSFSSSCRNYRKLE